MARISAEPEVFLWNDWWWIVDPQMPKQSSNSTMGICSWISVSYALWWWIIYIFMYTKGAHSLKVSFSPCDNQWWRFFLSFFFAVVFPDDMKEERGWPKGLSPSPTPKPQVPLSQPPKPKGLLASALSQFCGSALSPNAGSALSQIQGRLWAPTPWKIYDFP